MKLIEDFKVSKTIKLAWAKKLGGAIAVILANMGYFEDALTPVIFGSILIALGIIDNLLRQITTQALDDKVYDESIK